MQTILLLNKVNSQIQQLEDNKGIKKKNKKTQEKPPKRGEFINESKILRYRLAKMPERENKTTKKNYSCM